MRFAFKSSITIFEIIEESIFYILIFSRFRRKRSLENHTILLRIHHHLSKSITKTSRKRNTDKILSAEMDLDRNSVQQMSKNEHRHIKHLKKLRVLGHVSLLTKETGGESRKKRIIRSKSRRKIIIQNTGIMILAMKGVRETKLGELNLSRWSS